MTEFRDGSRRGLPTKLLAGSATLAVAVAIAAGTILFVGAHQTQSTEPCGDGVGVSVSGTPPGALHIGDTVTLAVTYSTIAGVDCDITSFDASLFFPSGPAIVLLDDEPIASGESITCPTDPRCVTPGPYTYTVLAADLQGPNTVCPPVPGPAMPGATFVHAYTTGNGPTKTGGAANACAAGQRQVLVPDVGVTKVAKEPKVNAGEVAQYNITVTNKGPDPATNVVLTDDPLPGDGSKAWAVTGADAAACDEDPVTAGNQIVGNSLNCNFGTLASGAVRNVSISVTTTDEQCGMKSNTATVSTVGEQASTLTNNSAGPVIITVNCPDVGVTKVAKQPKVNAGEVAQYNMVVTALGSGIHPGVTLTDVLPGGSAKGWTVSGADAAACDEDLVTPGIQIVRYRPQLQLRGHRPGRRRHARREHLRRRPTTPSAAPSRTRRRWR